MKKLIAVVLVCSLSLPAFAGLGSDKSKYVGGTTESLKKEVEGKIITDDEKVMVFAYGAGKLSIPYDKFVGLAYGQHAGRRVGATVAWGVTTLGIMALPMLFSKKRKHFLTIEYTDDRGVNQAAVFEIGKEAVRWTLKALEVRTGKKIVFEDDEARKAGSK
ncbi:MAG TPA: hypothetical protein VMZ25_01175 [Terriglobales bacterium]|nr:hypothetical protein [Terriglobales bacterium]